MSPLRIIFAGSGEFGVPTLRALLDAGHEVVRVISQPDRPAGRKRVLTPTPIAQLALERSLPLLRTENVNREPEPLPAAELLVVIAFGQKIAPHVVDHARLGSVNLHASLLPKYRGAAPINWAMLKGERVTGNSVIRLAERMDAGAVLGQSEVTIGELETAGELHDRLAADGAPLVLRVVEELATGRATEVVQDESRATLAPKLSRQTAQIDWTAPAAEISNKIRGLYPWPGCHVRVVSEAGIETGRFTPVRARPVTSTGHSAQPGRILPDGTVAAGDGGAVELVEVQPESKRPMPLAAYRNGHPWDVGARVESVV